MRFLREFSLYKLYIAHPMKLQIIKIVLVLIVFGIPEISVAQSDEMEKEQNELSFQDYFFEALKQKAILNYSKAVENLEKCAQLKEENVAVMFELSKNYLLMERYFEAEIFIDRCLHKEPSNVDLLRHKVQVYVAQQEFEKAIEFQKKVVEIKPLYRTDLAHIYIQNEMYEAAEAELKEIVESGIASVQTQSYINFLERRKELQNAVEEPVTKTIGTDVNSLRSEFNATQDFGVLRQLLDSDLKSEDYEALLSDSQSGLDLYPAQPLLYVMNATALNALGKYNDALVVLSIGEDFVVENPELNLKFYEAYLSAYSAMNNTQEISKYEQLVEKLRKELNE